MAARDVAYFIFDVESVADAALVAGMRYPGEAISPAEAVLKYRAELMEKNGSDFIPYTFQVPISVVIAKVRRDFRLIDLAVLDAPECRPHVITENFWRGWEAYGHPTFVTFNGRTFDIPLMELAAFRYGVSVPAWFQENGKSWDQPRNRYNTRAHLDLQDLLTNYGATRFNGGLNLVATLLSKPGKMDVQGDMVQSLYDAGKTDAINDYCQCDVLDTYFAFLRSRVLVGQLTLEAEEKLVVETKQWLAQRAEGSEAFGRYLEQWNDWQNPWRGGEERS
jgi:predicted PolB exonuclease-like 3'-5' exonuclease